MCNSRVVASAIQIQICRALTSIFGEWVLIQMLHGIVRTVHVSDMECGTYNVLSIVLTELPIMAKCTKQLPVF